HLIDARRMEVSTAFPENINTREMEPRALILDENAFSAFHGHRVCFSGSGLEKWLSICPDTDQWKVKHMEINARMMTRFSHQFHQQNNLSNLFTTTPLYIKKPYITSPKKQYFN